VFDRGSVTYRSDLKLGERYRDKTTGLQGHLVAVYFYEHACERGCLRYVDRDGNVQESSFDAPELVHVETGQAAVQQRTGGPERGGVRPSVARR
jgi:hypothetical protein